MLGQYLILIVNFLFFFNTEAVNVPKKCSISDSDCVTNSAQAFLRSFVDGIPEVGLGKSDPMFIKYVDASSSILKLILSNVTITGLRDTQVKRIKFDQSETSLSLIFLCSVQLEGNYEMSGKFSNLLLKGKGPFHAELREVEVTIASNLKDVTGKDEIQQIYYEPTGHTYQVQDKSDVVFENLFSENETFAVAAKEVIAQNGNMILKEMIIPEIIDVMVFNTFANLNGLFRAFAYHKVNFV